MNWSRIAETELGIKAWQILDNSDCQYHNGWHVLNMYDYLHDTNEPYDEALDWAILFHDIVYDDKAEKELRSAKLFVEMVNRYQGCSLAPAEQGRVYSLIMRTVDHVARPEVVGSSAIIRADLHALTNPVSVLYNYIDIMEESIKLYNVDEQTFAEKNIMFMYTLNDNVEKNMEIDEPNFEFYQKVKRGILATIYMSRSLTGAWT